ncbi:HTH_Tnp_Tc3_1 domain-containing protein [Trichonephila clavipes]|nr:HTH_Tnp_Tc3_1 domain-containing protein [Trichonephila clavipes]
MAGYQDLTEFERGVIISIREMGHIISEVAMKLGFSRTTTLRLYREYQETGTTLTSDRYVSVLSGLLHPFMSIVHSDELGGFQQNNVTPYVSRIAGSRSTLLNLDTSADHQIPQT